MLATRRNKLIGLLFLVSGAAVRAGRSRPTRSSQLIWMSFNSWSLITPPSSSGPATSRGRSATSQFWVSLTYSLKYTLFITPILMVGGYLIALLVADNTRIKRVTRTMVFIPVVIGLGVSSLLWYWLYNPLFGLIDKALLDLGLISKPILWLGTEEGTSTWAIIGSVTWKVIGFGMLLFVAAIQAIPAEVNEAAVVDGASYRQRVWRVTVPLTAPTILLVTLISVIGSLLAFDQFYIMTAGQPFNQTATAVFYVYLNSFPYLKLGYGAALSLLIAGVVLLFTVVQLWFTRRSRREHRVARGGPVARRHPLAARTRLVRPQPYLVGALCLALCAVMVAPVVFSILASVKSTAEAAAQPPTYLPSALSLDSYSRLWTYQAGLPAYLANSIGTALLTIVIALG